MERGAGQGIHEDGSRGVRASRRVVPMSYQGG